MKSYFFVGLLFFSGMFTLSQAKKTFFDDYVPPEYVRLIERNMKEFVKDSIEHYGVGCYGQGGAFMDAINEVDLHFVAFGPMNVDELRFLFLVLTEEYLHRVNSNIILRPYLKNYPFTSRNLAFGIRLVDLKGRSIVNKGVETDLLSGVSLIKGKLCYFFSNDEKVCLQDAYEEPYEEALAIVREQYPDRFPVYTYSPID